MRVFLKEVKGKKLTDVENLAALERIEVQERDTEPISGIDASDDESDGIPLPPNVDFDELDAETSNVITLTSAEWQEACMVLTKVCSPFPSLALFLSLVPTYSHPYPFSPYSSHSRSLSLSYQHTRCRPNYKPSYMSLGRLFYSSQVLHVVIVYHVLYWRLTHSLSRIYPSFSLSRIK